MNYRRSWSLASFFLHRLGKLKPRVGKGPAQGHRESGQGGHSGSVTRAEGWG